MVGNSCLINPMFTSALADWLESAIWGKNASRGNSFDYFLIFFGFYLGQISPYAIKLGLGGLRLDVVPLLWCYSQELCILFSVLSCWPSNGELPLHVR